MARTAAIGIQDFEQLIQNHYFYIDKTHFIQEWWESGDSVTLITRPRRFGKTLAMSMLEKFFLFPIKTAGIYFKIFTYGKIPNTEICREVILLYF